MKRAALAIGLLLACTTIPLVIAATDTTASATYRVDHTHSSVIFAIKHMNVANFYGRFNEIEGTFTVGDNGAFDIKVPTASIDTNSEGRDKHLKSPEFFNVEQHAEMQFKSRTVRAAGDKLEVEGDLTLLGKTQPLRVTLNKTGEGKGPRGEERCGFETEFTIKRSDFGMTAMMNGLGDEVRLIISVEGVKQ